MRSEQSHRTKDAERQGGLSDSGTHSEEHVGKMEHVVRMQSCEHRFTHKQ